MVDFTHLFSSQQETIEVFSRDQLISVMYVNYANKSITIENLSDDWLILPFGKKLNPTWDDYLYMLSNRVFPRERENCKELLKILGLEIYDPDAICRKTHGVMNDDYVWFKYPGEKVTFADVKMRD